MIADGLAEKALNGRSRGRSPFQIDDVLRFPIWLPAKHIGRRMFKYQFEYQSLGRLSPTATFPYGVLNIRINEPLSFGAGMSYCSFLGVTHILGIAP